LLTSQRVEKTVAAHGKGTVSVAGSRHGAVIARFNDCPHEAVTAPGVSAAIEAAVGVAAIAVVTLLIAYYQAVAASFRAYAGFPDALPSGLHRTG